MNFEVGEIPADLVEIAETARERMVEKVAENDDEAMELYVAGEPISKEVLMAALRRATLAARSSGAVRVLVGTRECSRFLTRWLTSCPARGYASVVGVDPSDSEVRVERKPSDDEPFCALAFKIATDPYVGKLA